MSRARGRKAVAIAVMVALVLPLAGCLDAFLPPVVRSTSTPTGETVAADLESFYSQSLEWKGCGNGLQCTTAEAPLDWSDPQRESISLALSRQVATGGTPLGSLLVNPGGPGASGYDLVLDSVDFATSEALQEKYDIVGFDPRGVNESSAVSCYDEPEEFDAVLFDVLPGEYGDDEWLTAYERMNARFGEACEEHTGELLGYIDTVSAARDLDLLRAILGDTHLNYLGYSYGTLLGAKFAELYPGKTGRLVLDGAIDPSTTSQEVSVTQAKGFESALRAYLAQCIDGSDCPFTGTVEAGMKTIRTLLDRLDVSPLRNSDGRKLGSATMTIAIIYPLYSRDSWGALTSVFDDVMSGSAEYAFELADGYYGRQADGSYATNSTEAFLAINCLDYVTSSERADIRDEEEQLVDAAPVLGRQLAYGGAICADWPFPPAWERGPIAAAGSADILVIGTTNDPATPYVWAKRLADQLENGHLVTYDGEGHTAYNKGSSCVDDTVEAFLLEGTVPAKDPRC